MFLIIIVFHLLIKHYLEDKDCLELNKDYVIADPLETSTKEYFDNNAEKDIKEKKEKKEKDDKCLFSNIPKANDRHKKDMLSFVLGEDNDIKEISSGINSEMNSENTNPELERVFEKQENDTKCDLGYEVIKQYENEKEINGGKSELVAPANSDGFASLDDVFKAPV